jgi:DUF4097 and DUF4098 domain-containing protein YvlB
MKGETVIGNLRTRRYRAMGLVAALLMGATAANASNNPEDQVQKSFEKTVALTGTQGLSLDNRFGSVHVSGGSGHDVKITATINVQAKSKEEAQEFADKIQIDVQQSGDGVHVRTVYPDDHSNYVLRLQWKKASYSVDYNVTVPVDAPLWLRNDFGNVETSGVHGWARIENGHGSIEVKDAGQTKIANAFGRIELNNANGNATIVNNNGSVEVTNVKGTLDIKNRFGSITATQIGGTTTISGGNGSVELTNVSGSATLTNTFGSVNARTINGSLNLHNSNAKVEVSDVTGNAELVTTFGELDVERVGGTLGVEDNNGQVNAREIHGATNIKTSFGRIVAANLYKGANLVTGNGNIEATDVGGDLYAKTSFGSLDLRNVKGNLTVQNSNGAVTAANVSGDAGVETSFGGVTLNGVGGRLRVNNQNGAIDVTASSDSCKDISLKTSFSHIVVRVPSNGGYRVSARTSFGKISSDLPITSTGTIGSDALNGTIGSGACLLELANSNGSIEIAHSR